MLTYHLHITVQELHLIMSSVRYFRDDLSYQPTARDYYLELVALEKHLFRESLDSDNYESVPDPDEESEI